MSEYNQTLLNCVCGKKPKLEKGTMGDFRYICKKDNLMTFFSKTELTARELFNSQIKNIDKLKVRV